MLTDTLGPGANVSGVATHTTRVNTNAAIDIVYWMSTFIAPGIPTDYSTQGPETDGVAALVWAAAQVGIVLPETLDDLYNAEKKVIPLDKALRTRGAFLLSDRVTITCGLYDVIDVVSGRFFMRRLLTDTDKEQWYEGYLIPGADY